MNWRSLLSGARVSPIGVDVGTRAIKAAQVRVAPRRGAGGAGLAVTAVATLARPDPEAPFGDADVLRLTGVLERQGFRGREVVLSAPATRLESDLLELPARSSGAPVDDLAAAEIGRGAKLDPGTYEAAAWDVPLARGGGGGGATAGTSVLAVALRHADADALVGPFEAAGYRVRAIDAPAWALSRVPGAVAAQPGTPELTALLDVGWRAGGVTLVGDAGGVVYQRVLYESGVGPLYRQLIDQHGLSPDAADLLLCGGADAGDPAVPAAVRPLVDAFVGQVADELAASLAFARHRYAGVRVGGVRVVGAGAKLRGFVDGLGPAVRCPVAPLTAPAGVPVPPALAADPAAWPQLAVAVGLARYPEAA